MDHIVEYLPSFYTVGVLRQRTCSLGGFIYLHRIQKKIFPLPLVYSLVFL